MTFSTSHYSLFREDFSKSFNISLRTLTFLLYKKKIDNCYKEKELLKKNGKSRLICSPEIGLKAVQYKIKYYLEEVWKKSYINHNYTKFSHGFEKKRNIITNARVHRNRRFVVNCDIENFFDSFNFGRVRGYFNKNKTFNFNIETATIIAQLVCYKNRLPQGAPTSPFIANLIFYSIDRHIQLLAKKYRLSYTRYADDLTFSTNLKEFIDEYPKFIKDLSSLLVKNGFNINQEKTRIATRDYRQEVTGLVVNKKINAKKEYIKTTRACANRFYKTGKYIIDDEEKSSVQSLEGRFAFIDQIDKHNNIINYQKTKYNSENNNSKMAFNAREREYQQFLFYKNFYNPEYHTIITEGKTDERHIKAALMKYYEEYPNLIIKENDLFKFKIRFFNKNRKYNVFLNINPHGADTFMYIVNDYKNFSDKLSKINAIYNNKNILLIIDNEEKPNKPFKKLQNKCKEILKNQSFFNDKKNSYKIIHNLFLLPLPKNDKNGSKDIEIENLYDIQYLLDFKHSLNMKNDTNKEYKSVSDVLDSVETYLKQNKKNSSSTTTTNGYAKNSFSEYTFKNYQTIDFSNFKPLLDEINKITIN